MTVPEKIPTAKEAKTAAVPPIAPPTAPMAPVIAPVAAALIKLDAVTLVPFMPELIRWDTVPINAPAIAPPIAAPRTTDNVNSPSESKLLIGLLRQ